MCLSRLAQLQHEHAGLDPCGACVRIDLDPAHALGLDQDRVVERAQGDRAVPGSLAGDLELVLGGEPDHLGDVLSALDECDGARPLVGDEVPGGSGLIPVVLARGGEAAADRQFGEVTHSRVSFELSSASKG
ncbi:MAG TPA: hypothetical protein VKG03_02580 [Solirubrobacterales bacterium]|nr:hypothetical protein [Solirubrobacterales bacterium]